MAGPIAITGKLCHQRSLAAAAVTCEDHAFSNIRIHLGDWEGIVPRSIYSNYNKYSPMF